MTYSLKTIRKKEKYYDEKDRRYFEKYRYPKKNKYKQFLSAEKQYSREQLSVPRLVHKKGQPIEYEGKLARVEKVTNKGVYIQKYSSENGLFKKTTKKPVFIPEKEYEKKAYPFYVYSVSGVNFTPSTIGVL
jgi:hypothetical protein